MSLDLLDALHQIEREKDIPAQTLVRTIEASLVSAYRKNFGGSGDIRVEIDWEQATFHVFARRTVVQELESEHSEIALDEAQRYRPEVKAGEIIEFEVTPANFGRIAAQTAKQVMMQRIREAERERIFDEFSGKEGELVTGEVQRRERRNVCVNVGRTEALLPPSEQVESEEYRMGQHLKFYILEVRKTTRSPQVVLSRSHPGLVKRLFELEVPELHEGIVELKGVSRHPGSRSKIAVHSHDANVDPVGACVGHRGSRVQAVVEELSGEKIDIIRWSSELMEFIASALSPAKVPKVVLNEAPNDRSCRVVVPEDQLSLAIGKAGQNVRLAARLTGYRIDICSQQQYAEELGIAGPTPPAAAPEAAEEAPAEEGVSPDAAQPVEGAQPTAEAPSPDSPPDESQPVQEAAPTAEPVVTGEALPPPQAAPAEPVDTETAAAAPEPMAGRVATGEVLPPPQAAPAEPVDTETTAAAPEPTAGRVATGEVLPPPQAAPAEPVDTETAAAAPEPTAGRVATGEVLPPPQAAPAEPVDTETAAAAPEPMAGRVATGEVLPPPQAAPAEPVDTETGAAAPAPMAGRVATGEVLPPPQAAPAEQMETKTAAAAPEPVAGAVATGEVLPPPQAAAPATAAAAETAAPGPASPSDAAPTAQEPTDPAPDSSEVAPGEGALPGGPAVTADSDAPVEAPAETEATTVSEDQPPGAAEEVAAASPSS